MLGVLSVASEASLVGLLRSSLTIFPNGVSLLPQFFRMAIGFILVRLLLCEYSSYTSSYTGAGKHEC